MHCSWLYMHMVGYTIDQLSWGTPNLWITFGNNHSKTELKHRIKVIFSSEILHMNCYPLQLVWSVELAIFFHVKSRCMVYLMFQTTYSLQLKASSKLQPSIQAKRDHYEDQNWKKKIQVIFKWVYHNTDTCNSFIKSMKTFNFRWQRISHQ